MVLLLIGDKKGTILRGIWVEFDDEIMMAYRVFLTLCYDKALKWAYDASNDEHIFDDRNEDARLSFLKPFLPQSMDFESFLDFYKLWKYATTQNLPIPATDYIIPYHFSLWNKFKGGSDTLTKLFWNGKHYVPSATPASTAVSHLFSFIGAVLRRSDAVMGSKNDLTFYSSLQGWRHANNQRHTSHQVFIRRIASCLLKKQNVHQHQLVTPPRILGRNSRNRVQQVEATWVNDQTGKTPARRVAEKYSDSSKVNPAVLQRRSKCTGKIICRVRVKNGVIETEGPGTRGLYVVCKMKTRFYCAGCHHHVCGPAKISVDENGRPKINFIKEDDENWIYFIQSCWHIHHEEGLSKDKRNSNEYKDV